MSIHISVHLYSVGLCIIIFFQIFNIAVTESCEIHWICVETLILYKKKSNVTQQYQKRPSLKTLFLTLCYFIGND